MHVCAQHPSRPFPGSKPDRPGLLGTVLTWPRSKAKRVEERLGAFWHTCTGPAQVLGPRRDAPASRLRAATPLGMGFPGGEGSKVKRESVNCLLLLERLPFSVLPRILMWTAHSHCVFSRRPRGAWPGLRSCTAGGTGGPCTLPPPGCAALDFALRFRFHICNGAPGSRVIPQLIQNLSKLFTQAARESAHQLLTSVFHKPQSSGAASLLLNPGGQQPSHAHLPASLCVWALLPMV